MRLQLGNLAEWLTAVGTLSFFGATWWTIRADHAEKRRVAQETRWNQAELVRVVLGRNGPQVFASIANGGVRQINKANATVWTRAGREIGTYSADAIAAGAAARFQVLPADDLELTKAFDGTYDLTFSDIAGIRWHRSRDLTLVGLRIIGEKRVRWWHLYWWSNFGSREHETDSSGRL